MVIENNMPLYSVNCICPWCITSLQMLDVYITRFSCLHSDLQFEVIKLQWRIYLILPQTIEQIK